MKYRYSSRNTWQFRYDHLHLNAVQNEDVVCSCSDHSEVNTFTITILRLVVQENLGGELYIYMRRLPEDKVTAGGPSKALQVYDIEASFASICRRSFPLMGCPLSTTHTVDPSKFVCNCGNFTLLGEAVSALVIQEARSGHRFPLRALARK